MRFGAAAITVQSYREVAQTLAGSQSRLEPARLQSAAAPVSPVAALRYLAATLAPACVGLAGRVLKSAAVRPYSVIRA